MRTESDERNQRWPNWRTRLALLVIVPVALVLGVRAVTWAAAQLKVWNDGDTLTAADLNANFAALNNPQNVVDSFNAGVTAGASVKLGAITPASTQYDLRWMIQHGAAAAACAAASPAGDSAQQHIVLVKPSGLTCTAVCAGNTAGAYPTCRTTIAIGSIRPTQATAYTDVVANNFNYACTDNQSAYDETMGQGLSTAYTAYCCCYR